MSLRKHKLAPSNKNIPTDQPKRDEKKKKWNDIYILKKNRKPVVQTEEQPSSPLAFSPQTQHQLSPQPAVLWSHSKAVPFLSFFIYFSESQKRQQLTPEQTRAACGPNVDPFNCPLLSGHHPLKLIPNKPRHRATCLVSILFVKSGTANTKAWIINPGNISHVLIAGSFSNLI